MTIATDDPDHDHGWLATTAIFPAIFGASAASDSAMQLGHHNRNTTIMDLPTAHTKTNTTIHYNGQYQYGPQQQQYQAPQDF